MFDKMDIPELNKGGRRFTEQAPEYANTDVSHIITLPENWNNDKKYPVLVEYTGNFNPPSGSTGEQKNASLGYGLIGKEEIIWVVMPFVSTDGQRHEVTWWGDEAATVEYVKRNVPRICEKYGGDMDRLFICGFSRGAIAVNYIGLYDDEVARLWRGFITHDHYDGVREWTYTQWGKDTAVYREAAVRRLHRLGDRPVLIMQNPDTAEISAFVEQNYTTAHFTFMDVPMNVLFPVIPNEYFFHAHNDKWLLFENEYTKQAREWLKKQAVLR